MRQQVLKALANPPRIFYVPYSIAVLNFAGQFILFIALFLVEISIRGMGEIVFANPMYFLISLCGVHFLLMGISKSEPQLANIISAKLNLFKLKIPKELAA